MMVPGATSAADIYIGAGVALAAALRPDPETASLADAVTAATERTRIAAGKRRAAREDVVAKTALRQRADYELDRLVRLIDSEALLLAGRDRARSPYRDLFPKGVTPVVAAPLAEEVELVKTLEGRLEGVPELAKHVAALRTARGKLEAAVAAHAEAVRGEAGAGADERLAKTDFQRQYRATYGALLGLFGDRGRADSYFVAVGSRRRENDAAEDDNGAEDDGPAPNP